MSQLIFKSNQHPGRLPAGYVYLQALGRPLLWCALPVMLGATTAVLLDLDPIVLVVWAMPMAVGVALTWTLFRLTRTVAKIHVTDGYAAVYSVWDVLRNSSPETGPLLHAERTRSGMQVSVGHTVYTLRGRDWPQAREMLGQLRSHAR